MTGRSGGGSLGERKDAGDRTDFAWWQRLWAWWTAMGEWRAAVIVALVAGLGHINALANQFSLDDDTVLVKNPLAHHLSSLWRAFAHPYWPETTPAGQYRPLAVIGFAVDWVISGGSPHWMHLVNVAWHVVACVLVWRLLRDLLSPEGALAGALYFALQPVHVEAIANTVGRCDIMAAAFVVAGVLAHRRGRWFAVPLYAAALASKEGGVVMLGLVAANDVLFGGAIGDRLASAAGGLRDMASVVVPLRGRALWRARRPLYVGYFVVAALYVVTLAIVFRHRPLVDIAPAWFHASALDRWLTEARVVPEYIRLMVFPAVLRIEYSPRVIDVAHTISAPVALGLALTVVGALCVVYAWRRAPVAAFGLLWFAIAISPVSNVFFASGVVLAERTLYLPSIGAAVLVGWAAVLLAARIAAADRGTASPGTATSSAGRTRRAWQVVGLLGSVVLVAFGVRSWTRTAAWHDDKQVLLTSLETEPESYRTHLRAALILDHRKDWEGAEREFAIARTLYPGDPYVYEGAAMVADMHDQFALADRLYDSASQVVPGLFEVYIKQAHLRYRSGNFAGAIQSARTAYLLSRDSTEALDVLTGAAQRIGDFASADWAFRRGLADHPRDTALHRQYSWMLAAKGDTAASRREGERANRSAP